MNWKNKRGSCFPSANHANGACIDIHYFYNANDENFLLAMKKFHFTEILVGNPNTDEDTFKPYIPHYKKLITLAEKMVIIYIIIICTLINFNTK